MNENDDLKDKNERLQTQLEERDQQIKDLEIKVEMNDNNSSKKDLNTIIRNFDFDIEGMYKNDKSSNDTDLLK